MPCRYYGERGKYDYCSAKPGYINFYCPYDDENCQYYSRANPRVITHCPYGQGSKCEITGKSIDSYCVDFHYCTEYAHATSTGDDDSSSGGCYLTTACVEHKGLPDDCYELTTLRYYRDTYLQSFELGVKDVQHYYRVAPSMVAEINKRPDKDEILEHIYSDLVLPMINLVESKKYSEAHYFYRDYVAKLEASLKS